MKKFLMEAMNERLWKKLAAYMHCKPPQDLRQRLALFAYYKAVETLLKQC